MRTIPLLLNHDQTKVIGLWQDGIGKFDPDQRITRTDLFNIFGGAGIRFLEEFEERGARYIKAFEILEFSLTPYRVETE